MAIPNPLKVTAAWVATIALGGVVASIFFTMGLLFFSKQCIEWDGVLAYMAISTAMSAAFSVPYLLVMLLGCNKPKAVRVRWHDLASLITTIAVLFISMGDGIGFLIAVLPAYYVIGRYFQFSLFNKAV